MGAESTSKTTPESGDRNDKKKTQVVLNVYDLTPANNYSYWFGFGVFHSGIEVHGKEYGFGGHDFPASGVFEVEPRSCPGFIYRCSVTLGHADMPPSEFRKFLQTVATDYHGDTYHLISKNCNHFTDDVSCRLTGKRIPGWVNRLARMGVLCSCLLPESLQSTTVKQLPEPREYSEEECTSEPLSLNTQQVPAEIDNDEEKRLLTPSTGVTDVAFVEESHK
ncbi:deSI-like protein At4g17486 isoform X1 [Cucurbita maxima]|uniref:DeSI-like protein At4g17486 isoform X1 n=1 Tax=Cucurbita maxima TaxID=3661 RepID=A0A6J1JFJ4_CUCMA|nr:deSI-like protein At4g17486 isoform X1 [Cucurbita maxima]XP_022987861.1 deSI-like protein At4g17486 isoform X1 [Cucurbita maxima]